MRRIYYFSFIFCFSLAFQACGDDDTAQEPEPEPVILAEAVETYEAGAFFEGYTLFAPNGQRNAFLIDMEGFYVNTWESEFQTGRSAYLLENGDFLRTAFIPEVPPTNRFNAGGAGGRIERYNWEGDLIWEFNYKSDAFCSHHDIEVLPNGNILILAWEYRTAAEAIDAGRDPDKLPDGELWPEKIVEIQPVGTSDANVVWEWKVWDHMIQDFDDTKANFGVVRDHPELIDINYTRPVNGEGADWQHANAVAYNADLDQIMISVNFFDELWIIDHSTTTAEAASHSGGNSGKGGDLLYRWGNKATYGYGDNSDKDLVAQHHTHWINSSYPGGGNILIFNNGRQDDVQDFSTVVEIEPPLLADGNYAFDVVNGFGPETLEWSYTADDIDSPLISGAERLPNGNTLITSGRSGRFVEVNAVGERSWVFQYEPEVGVAAAIFRSLRYAPSYPAFSGRDLVAIDETF